MAWVGAFAAVCNGGGRIIWGAVADRFSFKVGLCVCVYVRERIHALYVNTWGKWVGLE